MTRTFLLPLLLSLPACSDYALEPMPDIPFDAEPDIEVFPGSLSFGAVMAGQSALKELTIRNVGEAMLGVDPIAFEGAGAFSLVDDPGSFSVQGGAELVLQVAFEPAEPAALEGGLRVFSDDPDTPEILVPLSGEGMVPWLEITPATHDFGEVMIPCEQDLELVLQNVGNADLEVTALDFDGAEQLMLDAPDPPFVLGPGELVQATVLLDPSSPGEITGLLEATSNDPRGVVQATQSASLAWAGEGSDTFTVPEDPPVDVLFAVDRSGSMEDDALALGESFNAFIDALGQSTEGWNIGVVTYDHACFNNGILQIDTPRLEQLFVDAVTSGSDEEIVLDEQLFQLVDRALQQTVAGACNEGFLRGGAMLHVIVVSDEPERSPETASAWTWDYWLDRWDPYVEGSSLLKVSGVVDLDDCNEGAEGYLEAIEATEGEALSICSPDWAAHALDLAEASAEFLFSFALSGQPDPDSITVSIEGTEQSAGWSYDPHANAVVFDESLAESAGGGSEVVIAYGLASSCE